MVETNLRWQQGYLIHLCNGSPKKKHKLLLPSIPQGVVSTPALLIELPCVPEREESSCLYLPKLKSDNRVNQDRTHAR